MKRKLTQRALVVLGSFSLGKTRGCAKQPISRGKFRTKKRQLSSHLGKRSFGGGQAFALLPERENSASLKREGPKKGKDTSRKEKTKGEFDINSEGEN